jgi:hypothetical protein
MKTKPLITFLLLISISCGSNSKQQSADSVTTKKATINVEHLSVDTTGLLKECKSPDRRYSAGSLQGVEAAKDSIAFMCFMRCYTCANTYKIIFVYKGGVETRKALSHDSLHYAFENGCDNNFTNFDAFAFILPLIDPEKQEDEHGSSMKFPDTVKIYKHINGDNWHFMKKVKVNSFEEYGRLEFNSIYGL